MSCPLLAWDFLFQFCGILGSDPFCSSYGRLLQRPDTVWSFCVYFHIYCHSFCLAEQYLVVDILLEAWSAFIGKCCYCVFSIICSIVYEVANWSEALGRGCSRVRAGFSKRLFLSFLFVCFLIIYTSEDSLVHKQSLEGPTMYFFSLALQSIYSYSLIIF